MFAQRRLFAAATGFVCLAASAFAGGALYDNFGPDNGGFDFQYDAGWTIAGAALPVQYGQQGIQQAFLVTPDNSGKLTGIWTSIYEVPNAPELDQVKLAIAADTNGQFPQAADILEQWTISSFGTPVNWFMPQHVISVVKPTLTAGNTYWVWMFTDTPDAWCAWALNPANGVVLPHTFKRTSDVDWRFLFPESAPALRLEGGCAGDINGDGSTSVQDIFDFLTSWFGNLPGGDFNQSGSITVQDIFDFLTAWFAGCPQAVSAGPVRSPSRTTSPF